MKNEKFIISHTLHDVVLKAGRENANSLMHEATGKIQLTKLDNSSQPF